MTRIWVPGYDEVLDLFETYKKQDKNIERAKDRLASACWKQTSYLRRDPIRAYQEAPALQKYIEMREELNDALSRQIDLIKPMRDKILSMLELLDHPEKTVLYMYYVLDYSWVKVSQEVMFADSHCRHLRDQALATIAHTLEERRKAAEKTVVQ